MKAIVQKVNYKRGFVAYEIEGYDYGWLEILDSVEVEPEEEIEVTIAYICNKSMAESDSIYYMLDGTDINSEDIKAFKIDIQK